MKPHLWLGLGCLIILIGCGPSLKDGPPASGAEVSGKVLLGSTPLGGGTVRFVSTSNPDHMAVGSIGLDGTYAVKNAPVGPVKIGVETETAKMFDPAFNKGNPPPPPAGGTTPKEMKYVRISPKFGNADNSGLTYEVKPGSQQHDVVLK